MKGKGNSRVNEKSWMRTNLTFIHLKVGRRTFNKRVVTFFADFEFVNFADFEFVNFKKYSEGKRKLTRKRKILDANKFDIYPPEGRTSDVQQTSRDTT